MPYLLLVAFIGGAFSVLTPCVLPLLPAILVSSGASGRRRVVGIVVGIELSFFGLAIALAGVLTSLGLPPNLLQWVAAAFILTFGVVLIVPRLDQRFSNRMSAITGSLSPTRAKGNGAWSGFLSGIPLGLVWAPCAGPILAGIALAGGSQGFNSQTVAMMISYAAGMFGPLLAVAIGGRRISRGLRRITNGGRQLNTAMGMILIATAAMIALGWLNPINQAIAQAIGLTSTPTATLERNALDRTGERREGQDMSTIELSASELSARGYPEFETMADLGAAPDFEGITKWYNTEGIAHTIESLRGKVVLVDFWTYSCINCIRTLPHLKDLEAKYRDQGLVIVGVHTPEFVFEKDPRNVGKAIEDFKIRYPVALDPEYRTWDNYYNRYWPAHYLIDRDGHIRSVHYGEGAYDRTENQVRRLLALQPTVANEEEINSDRNNTPETYLGYGRADRFASSADGKSGFVLGQFASYKALKNLALDEWGFEGMWKVDESSALAGDGAEIILHFAAQHVFLVAGPTRRESGKIEVAGAGADHVLTIDSHHLYDIRRGAYVDGIVRLKVSPGIEVFSFTFG